MSTIAPELLIDEDDGFDRFLPGSEMTLAEYRALPDDPSVERMLIRGRLWERPMTRRTRKHARLESRIAHLLWSWVEKQQEPRPEVYSGEIGCEFPTLDSGMGIDVAVVSAELERALGDEEKYVVGVPLLVVEIFSPTDRVGEVNLRLDELLAAGVPMVWIVDPFGKSIVVHRQDAEPELLTGTRMLSADPILPGFEVPVNEIFIR